MPDSYVIVPLIASDGSKCGCLKPLADAPAEGEDSWCPAHGPNGRVPLRQTLEALRGLQYEGRFLLEVPAWSHVGAGKRQGRTAGGALGTSRSDMSVDIVLERHHDAIFAAVQPGQTSADLLGVEVSGPEHGTRGCTIKRDNKKFDTTPFKVLTVKHPPDDDNPLYYQEEAERVLIAWY